jgi:serine/threonine protein kinase
MAPVQSTRVTEDNGAFTKKFSDRSSYRSELDVLRGVKSEVAPKLLDHDDQKMTLRLEHAGTDLLHLVTNEDQRFSVPQIKKILSGLLQGLVDLHSQGFCHYDVTPGNVCIHGDLNSDFRVKLIDYGLSFTLDKIPETHKNQRVGTPSCLSPEHLECKPELGQAADVFCAGVTMLQVIQGGLDVFSPTYGRIEPQVREAHLQVPTHTTWGEPIPGDLNLLLKAMLSQDPTYRRSELCLALLGSPD